MADNFLFKAADGDSYTRSAKDLGSGVYANRDVRIDESGNVAPAGDTAAHAGYSVITDLTNTMPTGDAVARSLYVFNGEARKVISVTPTIDTAAYSTGDAVGGKQTLTSAARVSGGAVTLESLIIVDKANQKQAMDILFFNADPTAATITNNATFAFSTDIAKWVGQIHIATTDWTTFDSKAIVNKLNQKLTMQGNATANLYAAVVGTGTPTYLTAGDLIFYYGFQQS